MVLEMHASEAEQPEAQGANHKQEAPSPVEHDACDILMSLRQSEPSAEEDAQQGKPQPQQEAQGEAVAHRKRGRLSIVSSMKMEDISGYFHLNLKDAAAALGISVNTLKRVCRKLNIPKWPYRELKWMDKHRGKMQSYLTQHVAGERASHSDPAAGSSDNDAATDEGNSSIRSDRRKDRTHADADRDDEKRSPRAPHVPPGLKLDQYNLARAVAAAGMPPMPHRSMGHVDRVPYSSGMLPSDSASRPYMVPSDEFPYSAGPSGIPRAYLPYLNQHGYGMGYPHPAAHPYYRDQYEYQSRMWNMVGYMGPSGGLGSTAAGYPEDYMHAYPGRMTEEQFRMAKRQRRDMDYAAAAAAAAAAGMAKEAAAAAPGLYPSNFKGDIPSPELLYGPAAGFPRNPVSQSRPVGPSASETTVQT